MHMHNVLSSSVVIAEESETKDDNTSLHPTLQSQAGRILPLNECLVQFLISSV